MKTLVKLLVIDDDAVHRLLMKKAIVSSGVKHELIECSSINDIGDIDALNTFDCIFLDYVLPGENGLQLVKKIRDKNIKTPIVIVTAQGNESIAVELMKAGASDYLVKNDINGQLLKQVLKNTLRMSYLLKEREEAERALRVSESRLAEAQHIAKIGNWEFDTSTNTFYCSEEVYRILDRDKNIKITAENFLHFVHAEDRHEANVNWNNAFSGKAYNSDLRVVTPTAVKYIHCQTYPIANSDGIVRKIIGIIQDITERKLAEQEIMKAREIAENSLKVRDVFLANMSHEIRTPMNAILGFTRLLYETPLTHEQKGFIDAIHFSGENLLVIINDILDLSKIRSGKMTIEKCEFNLHALMEGIMSVLRPKAQEKGLRITCKIDQQVPSDIIGDPVRLNQILTNLISNALKFTEKGSVSVEINSTTAENDDVLIEFKVIDTGIGIAEDKQALIFENFVQASGNTSRKYGGTGLGLAIVKSLVELQDGSVTVTSQPGMGSTFKVYLPFEKAGEGTMHLSTEIVNQSMALEQLHGTAVLVVEDNAVNQLLVKKVLQKTGCKIDIASNGIEALTCIRAKRYDVVLMDIQMPEMDGYEATRQIRNELPKPLSEIPIIAMTAHAFGSDITRCISEGMNDYISKPFKAEDLYAKLIKHTGKGKDAKIISMNQPDDMLKYKIDLSAIHQLGNGDTAFINELILVYDKQTPAFIEKLKAYTKSHNYEAILSICHQIKSSYGILKMPELNDVLCEITECLYAERPEVEFAKIANHVNVIISLISAINEEVKRSLRKTG